MMQTWDWLMLLPERQRRQRRYRRLLLRLQSQLQRPRTGISGLVVIYLVAVAVLAVNTSPVLALLAVMPLLLVPLLAGLIYWLLWAEFHR